MTRVNLTLDQFFAPDADTVIDVRSPSEFAEDHVPGAINLPVLNDEERARVGTIYKQVSPFEARKIGAALVFRNAATHVAGPLADKPRGWRPLVYCWRGGQRSGAFAWMLGQIGWTAQTVDGGYRGFRRAVQSWLYDAPLPFRIVRLGGHTGTAKTALLPLLAARGVQVLDLEGLARHRGSLLGARPEGQPSQKTFETSLARHLRGLDPARVLVVEAESSKIGRLILPPGLWSAMKAAPMVEVSAPIEARARYLAEAYDDILSDTETLRARLQPLRYHRSHALVDAWEALIAEGARLELCRSLAEDHYDPAYDKSMAAQGGRVAARVEAQGLDRVALEALADRVAEAVQTIPT